MTVEPKTGSQSLAHWAHQTPHAIAVIEGGYRYTYADLAGLVVRMAKHLAALGLPPGSIAGIECSSRYIHFVLILACECLGLTTISFVTTELTADNDLLSRCAVLYSEGPFKLPHSVPLTLDLIVSVAQTPIAPDDFGALHFQPAADAGGRIVKTSGTTGKQKCMHNSPVTIERIVQASEAISDGLGTSYDFLCLYQFTMRPTYVGSVLALRFGRTVVFSTIADFRRELEAIGGGHTILLPGDAADLCEAFSGQARPAAKCGVHVDGGALGPGLRRKLLETFAYRVRNNYSMNETNYVAMVDEDNIGTVLSDAAVRIIGDDGHEKPMGETGRITVRTARMTRGYLWDEALTAKHFVDGWHITGDLGFQPEANQLVVVGRADDMLNIGGIKLPPQPIEAEIRTFDGVRDAVLLGVENAHGLLELHVVVERSDPGQDADLERLIRPLIHRYSRGFVGHYQDSLPRTQTGKVRRAALIAMIEAQSD